MFVLQSKINPMNRAAHPTPSVKVLFATAVLAAGVLPLSAVAQSVSPLGNTAAINTPTAGVLPLGSTVFAVSNSVPEWKRVHHGKGAFGGVTAGLGLLPGLEVFGRLTYDGDLQCNLYLADCQARTRDLSLNGKYQLPLRLPLNTRVAVGMTDYGGAATNFRSAYGVATGELGPFDLSMGYASKGSEGALLHGAFGSVVLHVTDQFQLLAENDSRAKRLGAAYTHAVSDQLSVQMGVSGKWPGEADQKTYQITAAVRYFFEKPSRAHSRNQGTSNLRTEVGPSPAQTQKNDALSPVEQAQAMVSALKREGYAQTVVRYAPANDGQPAAWQLLVEPLLKRHDQSEAIGRALAIWLAHVGSAAADVQLGLTYMGVEYQQVQTNRDCLVAFATGQSQCASGQALTIGTNLVLAAAPESMKTLVSEAGGLNFKPQFELGPSVVATFGTEYGLFDYSLGLDVGMQVQLTNGLFWQGNALVPVGHSTDFSRGGYFYLSGHPKTQRDQSILSYWSPLTLGGETLQTQVSAGHFDFTRRGAQADVTWVDRPGLWRVGTTVGAYRGAPSSGDASVALVSVKRSIVPGKWALLGTAGQFLGGDKGWSLRSQHWFGEVGFGLYLRSSGNPSKGMPETSFAGFSFNIPFGGVLSQDHGWASVRGRDRFAWGLETKVGSTDNYITPGYGEIPSPRHGVWTGITNLSRSGAADTWAQRQRVREFMHK